MKIEGAVTAMISEYPFNFTSVLYQEWTKITAWNMKMQFSNYGFAHHFCIALTYLAWSFSFFISECLQRNENSDHLHKHDEVNLRMLKYRNG